MNVEIYFGVFWTWIVDCMINDPVIPIFDTTIWEDKKRKKKEQQRKKRDLWYFISNKLIIDTFYIAHFPLTRMYLSIVKLHNSFFYNFFFYILTRHSKNDVIKKKNENKAGPCTKHNIDQCEKSLKKKNLQAISFIVNDCNNCMYS